MFVILGDFLQTLQDFLGQTWVMVGMGVLLVGLIGLLIFMQMRGKKDQ
jgi:hypothetical protein